MGQYPALALAYRRGDIATGPTIALETSTIDKLVAGGEQILGSTSLDALRAKDVPKRERLPRRQESEFLPEAFFVGRVARAFSKQTNRTRFLPLPEVDPGSQQIKSRTKEITWDHGSGRLLVNTPRFIAAGGFLGEAGKVSLGGFEIACSNEYAVVTMVSLDGLSLTQSKKVLVQCMTEEKPFGWQSVGGTIKSLGKNPMLVRDIEVKITKRQGDPWQRASALDENGYLRSKIPLDHGTLRVPKNAIYCLLERG